MRITPVQVPIIFETTGSTAVSVTTCGAPTGNSELNSFRTDLHWEFRLSPIISNVPVGVEGQVVKINTENTFTDITGAINTLPTASINYSGSGEQVVLAGAFPEGQAFTTYDLSPNTQYFFKIYSYTECAGVYYFSNTSDVISTHTPGVTDKLASNAVINNYTGTAFTLASFTAAAAADNGLGIPKGYIVKMNTVNSFTPHSFRGPTPTPDADYKGGEQVVYFGTSTTPNQVITGLTPDTTYYFTIYAHNDSGTPYFFNSYQQTGYEFSVVNNGSLLTPTITFDDVTVNAGDPNFNLNATSDSSGGISYQIINDGGTGTTLGGTNNETVTIGSGGIVVIEAIQTATATHQVAAKTMTLTINAPLATLGGGIAYEVNSGPTTLDMTTTISSNSTGAYTFEIIGETLGYTINGNLLNLNNVVGSIVIKVTQAADANYSETVAYYSTVFYNTGFSPKTDIAHNLFDFSLNPGESYTIITAQNFSGQTTTYSIVNDGGTGSTLIGNVFTAGGAGTVILRAFTPDNFLYNATTTDVTVTINGTPQTITFNPLSDVTYGDAAFDLTATASSGLVVSYVSSDPTIASISGSTVTIHKDGTVNITASQAGGGVYDPAPNVVQPLTVNPITLVNQNVALNTTGSGLCSTTATVSLDNTQSNVDYYLRNNSDNSIIEGPVAGTGSGISFASEVLTTNRTYNVMAVQGNQTLPSATNTLLMSGTPMASVQALDAKTINLTQPDGASAIVSVASSQSGISYYLQDNTTNEVLQGSLTGTGVDLSFTSETITADKTYKVVGTDATANHGVRTVLRLDNVNDYVSVPAISSHLSNAQQATIETWVKIPAADATDVNASIISFEGYTGFGVASVVVPFYINISGGTIFAGHYDDDVDDGGAYNTPGYTYPVDTWFHVAATMNGPAINFYVNGNLIGSTGAYSGFELFQLSSNIRLGRNYESTSNSSKLFGGDLAQTRIWNGIRTQTEITSTMNTQFTTPQTGLVLNYNYDQTSGTTVSDASGNTNTGTLQNGAGDATNWVNDLFTDSVCGFVPMSNTVTATHSATQSQTITFNLLATKGYGDATFDLTATSDSGLPVSYVSSDTSVATISGTTVTIVGAGTTTITASQAGDATYTPAIDVAQDLTVSKRNIEITADAVSRAYGDTDNLTYQITSGSLVSSDALTGSLTRVSGEDVGTYAIQQGTLSAGGSYNITFVSNDLTITQRAIEVTADAKTKIYGDADPAFTYTITSGSLAGSDTFTGALTRVAGQAQGNYAINQGTLSLGANYNLTFVAGNLYIDFRFIRVIPAAPVQKTYGDPDPALTWSHIITQGSLAYDDTLETYGTFRSPGENIGRYQIRGLSARFTSTNGGESSYAITYTNAGSVSLDILARTIEVTADVQAKTYGDADPVLSYQVTNGALQFGDTFSGNLTRVTGEAIGTYTINQGTLNAGSNYIVNYVGNDLTIGQRTIEITADALNKQYGDADPALTYQITNGSLVFSDAFTGNLTRVIGETTGVYAIQQGTVTAGGNYTITFVSNNFTIGKRTIEVTADAKTKIYGDADPVFTYTITSGSLVGSDVFTGVLDRVSGQAQGNYAINQGTLSLGANYNLSFVPGNLFINYRFIRVIPAAPISKTYGDADPYLTWPYIITQGSLAYDDTLETYGTFRTPGENVGRYQIRGLSALFTSNNGGESSYSITFTNGGSVSLDITARAIEVTADVQHKTYGDADPTLSYQITNGALQFSDTFSGSLTRVTGESVGTYAINQGTLSAGRNYTLSYIGNDLTIGQRAITITADDQIKVIGAADPTLTYQVTSGALQFSDAVTGSLTRVAGETLGNYAINQGTLSVNGDYNLTFISGTLNITNKIPQVITFNSLTDRNYGDTDFTLTATGGASGNPITYVSSNTSVATISGNTVTVVGVGTTTITASQVGNATYADAIDVSQTLTVNKGNQTITFNALTDVTIDAADFNLNATASSGLAITYVSSDPSVAMVTGNVISVVGIGITTITASQAGDMNWNAATDVLQSLTVIEACPLVNLPVNNFQIQALSETCTDKNNGMISINTVQALNYIATINNQSYSFTSTLEVADLSPGTYPVCISVDGFANCEQCFELVIEEAPILGGKTTVNSINKMQVEIASGTAPYSVMINDEVVAEYQENTFSVDVRHGDIVDIVSSRSCEGKLSKTINVLEDVSVYPNPTKANVTFILPSTGSDTIRIEMYNTLGVMVSSGVHTVIGNKTIAPMEHLQAGVYFVRIDGGKTFKIIKE